MPVSTSRFRALWPWLVEARFAWFTLSVIALALGISLRPHTSEWVIRLTGLGLQLLGIGTVIWGIAETRALFGHPSVAAKAKSWFGRCPLLRRNVVLAAEASSSGHATCEAAAYTTHGPGANPTLESRIDALEKNVNLIHQRIRTTESEMNDGFRKAGEALRNEEQIRQAEDTVIRKRLEATGTGGVHISAIGASWLFVGVVLSTAGVEIAELLK